MFAGSSRPRSVAAQVLAVQAAVALLVVLLSVATAYVQAGRQVEQEAASQVTDVARAIAATDDVRQGLASADPAAALAAFAERQRAETGTDFVVVMSVDGVRYTHPNPALVGGVYVGTIAPARAGGLVVEEYTGSLGPSTRAVVPVVVDGSVRGLVSVGLRRTRVIEALRAQWPLIVLPGVAAALLSGAGAWLVARRVRRDTLGLNARELARLHDHHEAVLHAVREGLVITDAAGRVQVVNDEAQRLLGIGPDAVGRGLGELGLTASLVATMTGGGQHADVPHVGGGRVLLVSSGEVRRGGRVVGALTTLRDRTELEELTGELGTARSLAGALHAQAHEAANRLHTVVTLVELGRPEEAVSFATDELRATQRQRDAVWAAVEEPSVAALLLGKAAQAAERGVRLDIDPDAHLPAGLLPAREAVTILGNLVDNAIDAAAGTAVGGAASGGCVTVDVQVDGPRVVLTVADTGPGLGAEEARRAFERGWTTKDAEGPAGRGIGLALVEQTARFLGGEVSVGPPPGGLFTVTLPVSGVTP